MYVYNSTQFVSARGVHRSARNGEKCVELLARIKLKLRLSDDGDG